MKNSLYKSIHVKAEAKVEENKIRVSELVHAYA